MFKSHRPSYRPRSFRSSRPSSPKKLNIANLIHKSIPLEREQFVPQNTFQDFPFHPHLSANIVCKGYSKPMPIQDKAILPILEGRDIVGIADTGTGKTAAFLLPLIQKVCFQRNAKVLILVPTRELALQIHEEFFTFSKGLNIFATLCVGGLSIGPQIRALARNPHFVMATPGRLKDLVERKCINLSKFQTVVLDEADRMVDMGFIQDIKFLLALMPQPRHSLFFSATLPFSVRDLIQQFSRNPLMISIKTRDTSANVDQDIIRVIDRSKKVDLLRDLLMQKEFDKVLIFGRTKRGVEKLSFILEKGGFKVASIHGNKSQSSRQKALNLFKKDIIRILVATDVAARGLDIFGVSHVINYDMPATYEDYIHRIGRTGRADRIGKALTFVE